MSDSQVDSTDFWQRCALVLGFILVVMGMANNLPNIPGLLGLTQMIPGLGVKHYLKTTLTLLYYGSM